MKKLLLLFTVLCLSTSVYAQWWRWVAGARVVVDIKPKQDSLYNFRPSKPKPFPFGEGEGVFPRPQPIVEDTTKWDIVRWQAEVIKLKENIGYLHYRVSTLDSNNETLENKNFQLENKISSLNSKLNVILTVAVVVICSLLFLFLWALRRKRRERIFLG